ncbi:MAG TPA: four helix bundle protein [Terriglobia bacterium]|nr:four helix bundle protein [Terriglobia bacterium]
MQHFKNLTVWQRSHQLVLDVYQLTLSFPSDERFGLTSQLRRSAASVPTNIAEGSKRQGQQDFARFLNIAEGSLSETEYLVMLSSDLGYIPGKECQRLLGEISEIARMLHSLRVKIEQKAA